MVKITDKIYCITTRYKGRKLNSYLICGEKTALIDLCPEEYADELLEKVKDKTDKIDYLIFTHTDRIRAGAIGKFPGITTVASIAGLRNLKEIANEELNELPAKESMVIDLGGISLEVIITPNLNRPDTMMLYIPQEKLLLSGTAFVGYNDGITVDEYCKSEMSLFADFAMNAAEKAAKTEAEIICPSEGDIQEDDVFEIYKSILKKEEKPITVAVLYAGDEDGYTAQLAKNVANTICDNGISVVCVNCNDRDSAVSAMNRADALCFASPTIHRNALPEVIDVMARLDCVNMRYKPCMITGSYGWGGEALGCMSNYAKILKLKVFEKPVGCIMKPSEEKLNELREFAKRFADFAKGIYNDNK